MLKLTKKADYGLIALKHLAMLNGQTASAKEMADRYAIPLPLLSKVLQKLTKAGFLRSEHGTNGGYRLAKGASDITTLEVVMAMDGPVVLTSCFTDHEKCEQHTLCSVREPLRKVHEGILGLLASIRISDMASEDFAVPDAAERRRGQLVELALK
jgi:FeS assembly SUF system regulator